MHIFQLYIRVLLRETYIYPPQHNRDTTNSYTELAKLADILQTRFVKQNDKKQCIQLRPALLRSNDRLGFNYKLLRHKSPYPVFDRIGR